MTGGSSTLSTIEFIRRLADTAIPQCAGEQCGVLRVVHCPTNTVEQIVIKRRDCSISAGIVARFTNQAKVCIASSIPYNVYSRPPITA